MSSTSRRDQSLSAIFSLLDQTKGEKRNTDENGNDDENGSDKENQNDHNMMDS